MVFRCFFFNGIWGKFEVFFFWKLLGDKKVFSFGLFSQDELELFASCLEELLQRKTPSLPEGAEGAEGFKRRRFEEVFWEESDSFEVWKWWFMVVFGYLLGFSWVCQLQARHLPKHPKPSGTVAKQKLIKNHLIPFRHTKIFVDRKSISKP